MEINVGSGRLPDGWDDYPPEEVDNEEEADTITEWTSSGEADS